MRRKINSFEKKALKYKRYVEKDETNNLINDIKSDTAEELTRVIANQKEDSKNNPHSEKLISFIKAELTNRNGNHSRWSRWIIAIATFVIAVLSAISLFVFKGK